MGAETETTKSSTNATKTRSGGYGDDMVVIRHFLLRETAAGGCCCYRESLAGEGAIYIGAETLEFDIGSFHMR